MARLAVVLLINWLTPGWLVTYN